MHIGTVGGRYVYQSRFKSFLVDTKGNLAAVCRYVERNAVCDISSIESLRHWHRSC